MSDLLDDDLEWDLWMEMTEAEHDAILDREMAALQRKLDAMTVRQQVAHHRHFLLRDILVNRHRLRDPKLARVSVIDDLWREHIRHAQVRLVKLRIWRATGAYPGEA